MQLQSGELPSRDEKDGGKKTRTERVDSNPLIQLPTLMLDLVLRLQGSEEQIQHPEGVVDLRSTMQLRRKEQAGKVTSPSFPLSLRPISLNSYLCPALRSSPTRSRSRHKRSGERGAREKADRSPKVLPSLRCVASLPFENEQGSSLRLSQATSTTSSAHYISGRIDVWFEVERG